MQGGDYMTEGLEMNTFSAFESLNMDDLLISRIGSSSTSSSASDMDRNPCSSLHNLPAWSTCEEETAFASPSYATPDESVGEKLINDVWFAPTANLSRKKRLNFEKRNINEEREVSPGVATANLKSYKSAPQLVDRKRVTSVDHRAKLEDLLVEMGWPRNAESTIEEASDGGEGNDGNQPRLQSSTGSGARSSRSTSTGAGSLASGMPTTSALFMRRADTRDGEMPAPLPVTIPSAETLNPEVVSATASIRQGLTSMMRPDLQSLQVQSAPLSMPHQMMFSTSLPMQEPRTDPSSSSAYAGLVNASQQYRSPIQTERVVGHPSLYYGYNQDQYNRSPVKRPESASTLSTNAELRTPITPFQALSTSDMGSLPYDYPLSSTSSYAGLLPSEHTPYSPQKMKSLSTLDGTLSSNMANNSSHHFSNNTGNLLGLQNMQSLENLNQFPPSMIDSSAYAQIFAHMPPSTPVQQQSKPKIKQMRSSPNMRRSPSSDDSSSSTKSLRKIASNRRLTISKSMPFQSENTIIMSSPTKSPLKKGKSPKLNANFAIPPLPTFASLQQGSPSTSRVASNEGSSSSFQFVNYGVEDADELCSGVAPSGSYKIPLKGFGSAQDDEDDVDEDDLYDDEMEGSSGKGASSIANRNRSKSNVSGTRLGPRWQGVEEVVDAKVEGGDLASDSKNSRQMKRRKSEASMTSLLGKKKTASSGNLRK
ncbi:hypothetical protein CBS101457_004163 [Exobasidium rhododendri]|nr:hypothetical protein CBS101457_004163 [Exobasidium rhododendri]